MPFCCIPTILLTSTKQHRKRGQKVKQARRQLKQEQGEGGKKKKTVRAMGNTATTGADPDDEFAEFDGIETLGYRVLGVQPDSPASKAGLVSFLDFIVGANGEMLLGSGEHLEEGEEYDDVDFPGLLQSNKGQVVELCKCLYPCPSPKEMMSCRRQPLSSSDILSFDCFLPPPCFRFLNPFSFSSKHKKSANGTMQWFGISRLKKND